MLYSRITLAILLLFIVTLANAQINRYIVVFKDKAGSVYSVSNPLQFLSQKAIERRTKQKISIIEQDLPVNESYVDALRNTGVSVFFKTRWLNGALIESDASLIPNVEALDFVQSVEFVAPGAKLLSGRKAAITESKDDKISIASTLQLRMIGVDSMHRSGYRGEGMTIAVLDSGFPGVNITTPFVDLFTEQRIDLNVSHDFVYNTTNVFQYDSHGTNCLSIIAAYKEGMFMGSAYKANFQLYVTEDDDTEFRIEEYNWLFAAERADSSGADIISTSVGYNTFGDVEMDYSTADLDGNTAVITRAAQLASEKGVLVVCAAGNEGYNSWKKLTAPADAKDVLAIANVDAQGNRNGSSSIGPSADNRIKPDLAALGTQVSYITPSGQIASGSGTSFAAPLVAGLAAGIWQQYPNLTNKQLIEVLKNSASQANDPDNFLGYGIPNYIAVNNYQNFAEQTQVLEVYPNPFTDIINIRTKNPDDVASCGFEVLTIQGQLVYSTNEVAFNWLNPVYKTNLSTLSSGLYLLRFFFKKEIYMIRVVKR